MEPGEKDFAQDQQSQGLPESDGMQAEEGWHQVVPKPHDRKTKDASRQDCKHHKFQYSPNSVRFHNCHLTLS
jgi:hypothetical protein